MDNIIAHISKKNDLFCIQTLQEHTQGVTILAQNFANSFGYGELAANIGILHDFGKQSKAFQDHICYASGYKNGVDKKADHKFTSATAVEHYEIDPGYKAILKYCIAGHHHGLPNLATLRTKLKEYSHTQLLKPEYPPLLPMAEPKTLAQEHLHFLVRMLFSCLVDADFLDTERFMNSVNFQARNHQYDTLETLLELLQRTYKTSFDNCTGHVNELRREILKTVDQAAESTEGIYSLTVPTGGGKTLSSMLWALRHAVKYKKQRVIVVIPYTSIIIQTSQIYRTIFGEQNVLEHHSNVVDPTVCDNHRLLNCENWDSPIVVTTNVQFFESMFSNKTSKCRKLHNICNSVVIFDEAQMLPANNLKPITNSLEAISQLFHSSVLIMSATQPLLTGHIGDKIDGFEGLQTIKEIIKNPDELQQKLTRVRMEYKSEKLTSEQVADALIQEQWVLCIVNSRKKASEIYDWLQRKNSPAIHLSRNMCQGHLLQAINHVKEGGRMIVVATQLVEAGVDIDFPVVYREMAGVDSIAQAAGRCNREGKLEELGKVVIFKSTDAIRQGLIAKGANITEDIIASKGVENLFTPQTIQNYFDNLFKKYSGNFDEARIKESLEERYFDFESAAKQFKIIEDQGIDIVTWWDKGSEMCQKVVKEDTVDRLTLRSLQPYVVSITESSLKILLSQGLVARFGDLWLQCSEKLYDSVRGVVVDQGNEDELFII